MKCKYCPNEIGFLSFAATVDGMCDDCRNNLCPECSKPLDSFACRIRHQQVNVGNLKRSREGESGGNFGLTERR